MRINVCILFVIMLAACQPKKVEPAAINIVWKVKSVKQNGMVVYTEGNSASTQPGYARFRLDLTAGDQVTFMDVDGRKLVGIWSLSTDNNRLILENLSPPPSGSSGNIEFYLAVAPTREQLILKRTNESRKTGNSINEYELVPE